MDDYLSTERGEECQENNGQEQIRGPSSIAATKDSSSCLAPNCNTILSSQIEKAAHVNNCRQDIPHLATYYFCLVPIKDKNDQDVICSYIRLGDRPDEISTHLRISKKHKNLTKKERQKWKYIILSIYRNARIHLNMGVSNHVPQRPDDFCTDEPALGLFVLMEQLASRPRNPSEPIGPQLVRQRAIRKRLAPNPSSPNSEVDDRDAGETATCPSTGSMASAYHLMPQPAMQQGWESVYFDGNVQYLPQYQQSHGPFLGFTGQEVIGLPHTPHGASFSRLPQSFPFTNWQLGYGGTGEISHFGGEHINQDFEGMFQTDASTYDQGVYQGFISPVAIQGQPNFVADLVSVDFVTQMSQASNDPYEFIGRYVGQMEPPDTLPDNVWGESGSGGDLEGQESG